MNTTTKKIESVEEAMEVLSLSELMDMEGYGDHVGESTLCPFHDDNDPSFSIFPGDDGYERWKCHAGCGSGGTIKFLMLHKDLSWEEAEVEFIRLATEFAKRQPVSEAKSMRAPKATTPEKEEGQPSSKTDWNRNWNQFVKQTSDEDLSWIAAQRGYSEEFVKWLHRKGLIARAGGMTGFPIAVPGEPTVGGMHVLGLFKAGQWGVRPSRTKMQPFVVGSLQEARDVYVFESQWDACAVIDRLGWFEAENPLIAFIATRGAHNGKLIRGICHSEAAIYAFEQNDETKNGRNAAKQWTKQVVRNAGRPVHVVKTPSEFEDPNAWTINGATTEEIVNAIQTAQPASAIVSRGVGSECAERSSDGPTHVVLDAPADLMDDPRPKIQMPGDNRLLSDFAVDVARHLEGANVFIRGNLPVVLNPRAGNDPVQAPLEALTGDIFRTFAEQFILPYRMDKEGVKFCRTMSKESANGVLSSPQFKAAVKHIRKVNFVNLPVLRKDGNIEILHPGYDAMSETLTLDSAIQLDEDMNLEQAKAIIDSYYSEFCFRDPERSKAVALAGLLTMFGSGLLPERTLTPCFIFVANREGAGKSLLVKCAVIPVMGFCPIGAMPDYEEETRKALSSAVLEAKPVIVFDNVRAELSSAALEGFLTSAIWSDRVLGHTKTFTGEKTSLVFVTGNNCTVSPDMRRRSLFCELFMEEERSEDRRFRRALEEADILELRSKVLSACWSLVRHWNEAGRPSASISNSSFPQWSNTIGGIVEASGYHCPLVRPQLEASGDTELEEMRKLVEVATEGVAQRGFAFSALADLARSEGLFESVLGVDDGMPLGRAENRKFSAILKRRCGGTTNGYMITSESSGHGRKYVFRRDGFPDDA